MFTITRNRLLLIGASSLTLALAACSEGGGGLASNMPPPVTPTPTPAPTPTPTPAGSITAMNIIDNAPTGDFAVAAAATASSGLGDPEWLADASLAAADRPQMKYDAATNTYEFKLPGAAWETLWTKDTSLPDWARALGFGKSPDTISLNYERRSGAADAFPYSTMGSYGYGINGTGVIAFGVPTLAAAVPTSGSARYDGIISGSTNVYVEYDSGAWAGLGALGVSGPVTLWFDFGSGTLDGSMEPKLGSESLGVFTFTDGVYSAGSYSGRFNSSAPGQNGFYGELTGPNGQELIGAWALPFHYSGDGLDHNAMGAWVAKRAP